MFFDDHHLPMRVWESARDNESPDRADAVIINSMWRTGSTYVAKQFYRSARYLLFYEPAHEQVGKPRRRTITPDQQRARAINMRHPTFDEPLFSNYLKRDPQTGQALSSLFDASSTLRNAYGRAADEYLEFLKACSRVAAKEGRVACFGFCRSGLQHRSWDAAFVGPKLFLWREPRSQFRSYGWKQHNTYFVPSLLAQLLHSEALSEPTSELLPRYLQGPFRILIRSREDTDFRTQVRLGRLLAEILPMRDVYKLFYLSWLCSKASGEKTATYSFSLAELSRNTGLRSEIGFLLGVDFVDLRPAPEGAVDGLDYKSLEQEVERLAMPVLDRLL